MLTAYIDGGCQPINPGGTATYGILVLAKDKEVWRNFGVIGTGEGMSNNVAEYWSLIKFLNWFGLRDLKEEVLVLSDSQLLVNQIKGGWKIKKGLYAHLAYKAKELLSKTNWKDLVKFEWIPREKNLADELARQAFNESRLH